jgi:hypothetical protein
MRPRRMFNDKWAEAGRKHLVVGRAVTAWDCRTYCRSFRVHAHRALADIFPCGTSVAGLTGFERGATGRAGERRHRFASCRLSSTCVVFYSRPLGTTGATVMAQFGPALSSLHRLGGRGGGDRHRRQAGGPGLACFPSPRARPRIGRHAFLPFQHAINLISPLLIALAGALGPFLVFGLWGLEWRIAYLSWSLAGLIIYCLGTGLAAASEAISAKPIRPTESQ